MASIVTPYSGALALINKKDVPTWMNEYDAARIATYDLYENIYWAIPQTFKLQQRGGESNPIYVPSGRVICNTMDRYTGVDFSAVMDPAFGTPEQQAQALMVMTAFLRRERFKSKYESNKLYGIIRGDWCFYITANSDKAPLSRLSLNEIDPRMVFPIEDPNDADRILGYDIVEEILIGSDTRIKRTRYLKSEHPEYAFGGAGEAGGPISYEVSAFEVQGWESPTEQKEVSYDQADGPVQLPTNITALPIYHIKNIQAPADPFGSSEMRGVERLMAAINQSITDEELALALEGLGMYKSSKAAPEGGSWGMGPGRVVHDENFERVMGVHSVTPHQDHLKYLHDQIDQVTGTSDVAKGMVDVTVAESGIALRLRMSPILSASAKKDTSIKEVLDNMLWDLREWFKAYEGIDMTNVVFVSRFGSKLPVDDAKRFDQLLQMYSADPPLITAAYFRDACREMGIDIPADMDGAAIALERAQMIQAMDPYGDRLDQEAGGDETPPETEEEIEV